MLLLLASFSEFFPGTYENPVSTTNSRQIPVSNNVYLCDCFFKDMIQATKNGGAIMVDSSSVYKILVEKSTFHECIVGTGCSGGAIYINNIRDGVVFYQICVYMCSTGSLYNSNGFGQYCYIKAQNTAFSNVLQNSISHCYKPTSLSNFQVITIFDGIVEYKHTNSSNNNVYHGAGLTHSAGISSQYLYNTISFNIARLSAILYLDGGITNILFCNLINNSQLSSSDGIIRIGYRYTNSNITFSQCTIYYNTKSLLLYRYSGVITFINCNVDDNSASATFTLVNSIFNTLNNIHYSTYYCDAKPPERSSFFKSSCKNIFVFLTSLSVFI